MESAGKEPGENVCHGFGSADGVDGDFHLSLIHIPSPRDATLSRMPSSA